MMVERTQRWDMGEHGLARRGACVEPRVGVSVARDHLPICFLWPNVQGIVHYKYFASFARRWGNCPEIELS